MIAAEPGTPPGEPTAAIEVDLLDTGAAGPQALRGSALRTSAYVLGILLSLVSAPLLIRHLGVEEFGRYVTVLSLITIVAGFTEGGLNSIVLREFATLDADRRREMMRSAIGIRIVLTLAGVGLAVGFAAVAGYGSTLVLATLLAGVALVFQLLQSLLSVTLQAQLRFGWASAIELLRQVVYVALIVGLVLADAGLLPLIAVAIPAAVVSLACTVPLVLGYLTLWPSFHVGRWWHLLRESVPWAVVSAVNIVYFRITIVLLSLIASAQQTGYFATSFRITEVLVGLPPLVVSAAFPILARAHRDDPQRFSFASSRIVELSLLAGSWLVLCLEVGAPFAIHVIAGQKADPSIAVLRIQGAALVASFLGAACGFPLLIVRRYRPVVVCSLLALFASGALTLLLAPSHGARGAALAALLAEIGLGVSQAVLLKRAVPSFTVRWRMIASVAAAAGLAVVAGLLLPAHPVIGVVVASAVYFAMLKALGRFPPEVREILGGWIGAAVH